jgi:hypothetical protein
MPSRRPRIALAAATTAAAALVIACGNPAALPAPTFTNVVDTVSLFALRGTDISLPSAYTLDNATPVRSDQSTALDFAFDFDSIGEPALFPTGAIGLGSLSGLQSSTTAFDAIALAPTGNYDFDKPIALDTGTVVLVRSRPTTCLFGVTVSLYAKLRVLSVDSTARRLDFEILVDRNCGYRGLAPGLPKQ